MPTLLLTHPSSLDHEMGASHPERPDRVRAIEASLTDSRFNDLIRESAPEGKLEHILLAHPQSHFDFVESKIPQNDYAFLDGDTVLCSKSWLALLHAVGGAVEAVDRVMAGDVNNAFCALRPPGHHAEAVTPMGFCFFNNAAIAAYHAKQNHNLKRVAIIDFDVHHGNGTQDILWDEPDMFYGSTHEMPLYPGSGSIHETGAGNIFNAPLPAGCGSQTFREVMEQGVLKPLADFTPQFVIISAGFDAHERDPLSTVALEEEDFAWVTRKLMDIADSSAEGRVVSVLEGGYDLVGLAQSVAVHVETLMEAGT